MSKDLSLSPKSTDTRFSAVEPLSVDLVNEEQSPSLNQLSFTATLSSSYVSPEDLEESVDDLTLIKDKKKARVGRLEDQPRKRKDTANSITNFFHRFTRSDKEDKKIVEEEEHEIGRPDKLASPDSDDRWFESTSISALEGAALGHEGDADVYEWDPNTMNETLVLEPLQLEESSTNSIFEEKGMLKLLENFRNGEMRWLDKPQIAAMCKVKEAHEDITNTRLRVFDIESESRRRKDEKSFFSDSDDDEQEEMIEKLFEQMNAKMVKMHSFLDTVPFYDASQQQEIRQEMPINAADDEYFSS